MLPRCVTDAYNQGMRRHSLVIGMLFRLALQDGAQTAPVHVVTGLVFDSVAGVPLAGAVVQIVSPAWGHRAYSAIRDWSGATSEISPHGVIALTPPATP